jgi:uncharacterized membrane protein
MPCSRSRPQATIGVESFQADSRINGGVGAQPIYEQELTAEPLRTQRSAKEFCFIMHSLRTQRFGGDKEPGFKWCRPMHFDFKRSTGDIHMSLLPLASGPSSEAGAKQAPSGSVVHPDDRTPLLPTPSSKYHRYSFIDLLRGLAVLVMVETHVVNAYLPADLRHNPFFFWLTFVNGLVAPSFLFAAGMSIFLQADRYWDSWLHFKKPFWMQMRRLGFITLVAYYIHLQDFRLSKYLVSEDPRFWARTFQVDVLQCIVASLLIIHLLIILVRKPASLVWSAGTLAVLVSLMTPVMWAQDFQTMVPLPFALFLNPHGVSLFPLFPWLCFVLAGFCLSYLFLQSVAVQKDTLFMKRILMVGAAMILSGLILRAVPYTLPGYVNFYTTSPLYVAIRIGCVLVICSALYWLEKLRGWAPRLLVLAGQESLLVYAVHLLIIYSFLRGKIMRPIMGAEMRYLGCFALTAVLILLMMGLAWFWHGLKQRFPKSTKLALALAVPVTIVVFLLR